MIEDLDKKIDKSVTIPNSLIIEVSKNIRALNQASEVAFEEEQPKVETFKL